MNNIKNLRKLHHQTVTQLARAVGTTQSTMTKIENGNIALKSEMAQKIADIFGTTVDNVIKPEIGKVSPYAFSPAGVSMIEIIDARESVTEGGDILAPKVIGHQLANINLFPQLKNISPDRIKILSVYGDSMQPTINDQDSIWVDISITRPESDGLYLFCIRQELMVKRVRFDIFNNSVMVSSDNPLYPPLTINNPDKLKVCGKVIAVTKFI